MQLSKILSDCYLSYTSVCSLSTCAKFKLKVIIKLKTNSKMNFNKEIVLIGLLSLIATIYAAPADNPQFAKFADVITQMLGGL